MGETIRYVVIRERCHKYLWAKIERRLTNVICVCVYLMNNSARLQKKMQRMAKRRDKTNEVYNTRGKLYKTTQDETRQDKTTQNK
jgi:hypothetical protein